MSAVHEACAASSQGKSGPRGTREAAIANWAITHGHCCASGRLLWHGNQYQDSSPQQLRQMLLWLKLLPAWQALRLGMAWKGVGLLLHKPRVHKPQTRGCESTP